MLKINNLCKYYDSNSSSPVVNQLSFSLEEGKFLAIVGKSGSGKSTLLSMISALTRPSSGQILLNDIDPWQLKEDQRAEFRNRELGLVFQMPGLLPTLKALDNVALPALINSKNNSQLNEKEIYAKAQHLLTLVDLGEHTHKYFYQLSGGEQRRVAIARALINSPKILLADEPTGDLDKETEKDIVQLLISLNKTEFLSLILVTHNENIAKQADFIVSMRKENELISGSANTKNQFCQNTQVGNESVPSFTNNQTSISLATNTIDTVKITLGEGIERFVGKFVLLITPIIILSFLINFILNAYQNSVLEAQNEAKQSLEDLAMKSLRADIKELSINSNGDYKATFYLKNTSSDKSIFVMSPNIRAFIQVGSDWVETPMKSLNKKSSQVEEIKDCNLYTFNLNPDIKNYAQLIPGYLHVRFSNEMLISSSKDAKADLYERSDNYYVYLKPKNANDKEILSKLKFPGKPPLWIPMPPH